MDDIKCSSRTLNLVHSISTEESVIKGVKAKAGEYGKSASRKAANLFRVWHPPCERMKGQKLLACAVFHESLHTIMWLERASPATPQAALQETQYNFGEMLQCAPNGVDWLTWKTNDVQMVGNYVGPLWKLMHQEILPAAYPQQDLP